MNAEQKKIEKSYLQSRKNEHKQKKKIKEILDNVDVINSYCRHLAGNICVLVGCACACNPRNCSGSGLKTN
jgi:hypothetical protein